MKTASTPTPRTPGLSLSRLRAMIAVADEGSFSAAARRLGVSHSAISQQIREMEATHGIHLFDRKNGTLRPTPMCLELCDIGARVQEAEREAQNILDRRNAAGKLRLRVGLGNAMPGIAILSAFIARCPGISVSIESGSHESVMQALLQRRIDVAVLPDVPADPRFRQVPVLRHDVVAIAASTSPLAQATSLTVEQLAEVPLIFRSRGSSTQRVVDRAFRRAGLYPEPKLTADTRDAVYEAVASGIGVGFMWRAGTARTDMVRRITVADIGRAVDE
ncbi:MAG: LysR family transcriptional regulator, partial [Paracoccaceae bacterium]